MAESQNEGLDLGAAVTRSLLGWGVGAGVFYLAVGVTQGLIRDGFSFAEHPLSLLMLGDLGWIQMTNLILTGLMVIAAAIGFRRAMKPHSRAMRTGLALGTYGLALLGAGIFPPRSGRWLPNGELDGRSHDWRSNAPCLWWYRLRGIGDYRLLHGRLVSRARRDVFS